MGARKFKVTVTKTTEFEVEFDEEAWSKKNIDEWKKVFYDVDDLEDVATKFGPMYANEGPGVFIEGFGVPLENGCIPIPQRLTAEGMKEVNSNINVKEFTEDYDTDVEEVTE